MKSILPVVIAAPLLAAACVPDPPAPLVEAPPATTEDSCNSARYQPLVGQTSPTITVGANVPYRIVREGMPMTMEYAASRLTFTVDQRGKLKSVRCG